MSIRANDFQNDWEFGLGRSNYFRGEKAIEQDLRTSLQCWLNDCFWRLNFGVDWANLLGSRGTAAQSNLILQCRQVIVNTFGVTSINSVNASRDALTRRLSVQYDINDIFTLNFKGSAIITP